MHFYDAVAPIVSGDSLDYDKLFFATRYDKGEQSDYLNCGMNKDEYTAFYEQLVGGQVANLHSFEKGEIFESCMPIEVMANSAFSSPGNKLKILFCSGKVKLV